MAGGDDTTKGKREARAPSLLGLFLLCLLVVLVWVLVTWGIHSFFPNWSDSGPVGDTFGAVNALFSGLAFAGVVYALNLQRRDLFAQREEMLEARRVSEDQLAEMRAARELQGQPLALPKFNTVMIEQPKFFYTPPEDRHNAQSRYFVNVTLENPTQYAALNVNARCGLEIIGSDSVMGAVDSFIAIIPPMHIGEGHSASFMFVGDESGALFDAVQQNDPRRVPTLHVLILFKSAAGAHFSLRQAFRVYASADQTSALSLWHSGVAGFGARYKQEITRLKDARRRHQQDEWDQLFDAVKEEFSKAMGNGEGLSLTAVPVPTLFQLQKISKTDFDELMEVASYPQIVSQIYDCPAELDSRKQQS
ncbi:MAG TPA: hypothetical protein VF650_02780 [Allosphingosinicella sp.]|jgi:hypothetical protein